MIKRAFYVIYALLKLIYVLALIVGLLFVATAAEIISRILFKSGNIDFEAKIENVIYRYYNIEVLLKFRTEILEIIDGYIIECMDMGEGEKYDSWALERQIVQYKEESKRKFETAERVTTIFGGLSTLIVAAFFNVNYAGIILTLIILFLSILLIARVVISDMLSYDLSDVRGDPNHRLVVKSAFNYNIAFVGIFLFVSSILMVVGESKNAKEFGLNKLDNLVYWAIVNFDVNECDPNRWQENLDRESEN